MVALWRKFAQVYNIISDEHPSEDDLNGYFALAQSLILNFLTIGQYLATQNVTPYMHQLVYHVPKMPKNVWKPENVQWTGSRES